MFKGYSTVAVVFNRYLIAVNSMLCRCFILADLTFSLWKFSALLTGSFLLLHIPLTPTPMILFLWNQAKFVVNLVSSMYLN